MNTLNIDRSIAAILEAARQGKFISYGDVAKANGFAWSFTMNHLMPKHLDMVLTKADTRGWPLITAVVVNKQNILSGKLEEKSLSGFVSGARGLGYDVGDNDRHAFLEEQQRETFAFAKTYQGGDR
jgi:5-methylcytosine-specific restriction protein B